jgi:hypothetical protein
MSAQHSSKDIEQQLNKQTWMANDKQQIGRAGTPPH